MYESYRSGSIISLHLKNFQTYQNTDFYFHPQLNFIAGPNGSGKSSVANAIAFIFCGTPGTIGKTKEITEYVNFNAGEASVEATIKYKERTCLLKRVFNKVNKKSIWYIDGVHKKQTEYVLFVQGLNINVDNLCQFLPQEKVSEFASLSHEELLVHTLDSQGDKTIVELKDELGVLEKTYQDLQSSVDDARKKEDGIGRIVQKLGRDVDKLKEKSRKEEKIGMMRLKRKWLIYELLKREFKKVKDDMQVFKKEISAKEQLIRNCEEKIRKLRDSEEIKKLNEEKIRIEVLNDSLGVSLKNITGQYKHIDLLEVDKKSLLKKKESRTKEIEGLERNLHSSMEKLQDFKIDKVGKCDVDAHEIDKLEETLFDLKMQKSKIGNESQNIQKRVEELQRKHQRAGKEEYRRLEFLRKYHTDTYNGVMWLRENKGMFREEIIEPPVLSVQLRDSRFLAEVETFLNFQLLSSFICQNSDDFELFLRILKDEKNMAVNAIEKIDEKRKNTLDGGELKTLGFDAMLIDMIEARTEVKNFFNSVAHFNSIPIAKKSIDESNIFAHYEVKRMATRNKFVEIKRSQYNRSDFVISESCLASIGLFSQFSAGEGEQAASSLKELDIKRSENRERYKEIMQKAQDAEKDLARMYKVRNEYMEKLNSIQRQKARKEQIELSIVRFRKQIELLNDFSCLEEEEELISEKTKGETENAVSLIKNFEQLLFEKEFYSRVKVLWKFEKEILEQSSAIEKELAMKCVHEDEVGALQESLDKLEREKENKREKMEEYKGVLKKRPLDDEERMEFSNLPGRIEDLETAIALESAKLPFYDCDPELEKDFISKENELNKVHMKMSVLETKAEVLSEKIKSLRGECISRIRKFVEPLNERILGFFKIFKCEGKVVFVEENLESSKWKLNILVKFRHNAGLDVLVGTRQSGGEKSVSTILFLLALQNLTPAPFRLVDEINQGMDRHNEKLVHNTLVSLSAPNSPQFFIITPKIVPDLTFCENMKVHIVFAASFNSIQKSYDNYKFNILK